MHALGHRATTRGLVLPGRESLKAQVSRWENGHVVPDAQYRRLLREVYGLNDADLGLVEEIAVLPALTAPNELQDRLAASTAVDAELVSLLQAQTDTVRQLDRRLGAPVLLEQMRGHIAGLVDLLRHAVLAKERKPVAAVLADAARWPVGSLSMSERTARPGTTTRPPRPRRVKPAAPRCSPTRWGNRPTRCSISATQQADAPYSPKHNSKPAPEHRPS